MPKTSAIISTYNRALYVGEAIRSVLAQNSRYGIFNICPTLCIE